MKKSCLILFFQGDNIDHVYYVPDIHAPVDRRNRGSMKCLVRVDRRSNGNLNSFGHRVEKFFQKLTVIWSW